MEFSYTDRAQVLVEALPYIQDYSKKTIVIKYGGNAMLSEELRRAVISDIILLKLVGINVVVVHGGGPEIAETLEQSVKGTPSMDVVQMVLCGKVNKDLVSMLNRGGCEAVGLCGMDGGMLQATKLETNEEGLGAMGEISAVQPKVILDAIQAGCIPVIATVAQGADADVSYNVNADAAAAKIAIALKAEKLIVMTDVRGLLQNKSDDGTLLSQVRLPEVPLLVREGVITGGMLSKVECCVEAVRNGVKRTHILDGRIPHSILIEVLSDAGIGTMIL